MLHNSPSSPRSFFHGDTTRGLRLRLHRQRTVGLASGELQNVFESGARIGRRTDSRHPEEKSLAWEHPGGRAAAWRCPPADCGCRAACQRNRKLSAEWSLIQGAGGPGFKPQVHCGMLSSGFEKWFRRAGLRPRRIRIPCEVPVQVGTEADPTPAMVGPIAEPERQAMRP